MILTVLPPMTGVRVDIILYQRRALGSFLFFYANGAGIRFFSLDVDRVKLVVVCFWKISKRYNQGCEKSHAALKKVDFIALNVISNSLSTRLVPLLDNSIQRYTLALPNFTNIGPK